MIERPACPRCGGKRFVHSRRMLDVVRRDDVATEEWRVRPVAVCRDENDVLQPVGHFETLVCTGCGCSRWYAFGWHEAPGKDLRAACSECADETPQRRMSAVEHIPNGFDQPPLTRGRLSHEGRLFITVCRRCDAVRWTGADYEQLDRRYFVAYKLRTEHQRLCLACRSPDALVDEHACELDGTPIPVAVQTTRDGTAVPIGGFSIRLCRPCGSVEWYAHAPASLKPDDAAAIFTVGPTAVQARGPYR